jgi:hypothetical protein
MNAIDFTKYGQFPVSEETFDFMQNMILLAARTASLGGTKYILSGCTESGNTVSAGYVVVDGEILPFSGGAKGTYVVISETKNSVQVYETNYADIYTDRKVIFGTGSGQIAWSDFKNYTDLATMSTKLASLLTNFTNHINNHTVAWANVSGKPSAFTPVNHTHPWTDISDKPTSYPPSAHTHAGILMPMEPIHIGDLSDSNNGTSWEWVKTISLGKTIEKYRVFGCLRTEYTSSSQRYDNCFWQIFNVTSTSFDLCVQTIVKTDVQNLYFDYALLQIS